MEADLAEMGGFSGRKTVPGDRLLPTSMSRHGEPALGSQMSLSLLCSLALSPVWDTTPSRTWWERDRVEPKVGFEENKENLHLLRASGEYLPLPLVDILGEPWGRS